MSLWNTCPCSLSIHFKIIQPIIKTSRAPPGIQTFVFFFNRCCWGRNFGSKNWSQGWWLLLLKTILCKRSPKKIIKTGTLMFHMSSVVGQTCYLVMWPYLLSPLSFYIFSQEKLNRVRNLQISKYLWASFGYESQYSCWLN